MKPNRLATAAITIVFSVTLAACGSAETSTPADEAATDGGTEGGATEDGDAGSVSTADDTASVAKQARAPADPIRGPGGMEETCLARVAAETGATVGGLNHIEESEAAIEIYVNVDGADAPWKCHGYADGTIDEVTYTGSEGGA